MKEDVVLWSNRNNEIIEFINFDLDNYFLFFKAGLNIHERTLFQILFQSNWEPLFIATDDEKLTEIINHVNTFIQRRGNVSVKDLLKEMEVAFRNGVGVCF
jgi:hypothetical protein